MNRIEAAGQNLKYLDELALRPSAIGRLNPTVKLVTTLVFIIVVASFPRYAVSGLIPLIFYPVVLLALGELPVGYLLRRVAWAAPFALFVGLFNPLLDREPLIRLGGLALAGGWVSLASIMLKFTLTVLAGLILIATTGINQIGAALRAVGLPRVWVGQLLFLYRYLFVLLEEALRTLRAYTLRSGERRGVLSNAWGSLMGQLLLRTVDRAQRIYQAMLCRGYNGELPSGAPARCGVSEACFLGGWSGFFLIVRLINLPQWIGNFWWGLIK